MPGAEAWYLNLFMLDKVRTQGTYPIGNQLHQANTVVFTVWWNPPEHCGAIIFGGFIFTKKKVKQITSMHPVLDYTIQSSRIVSEFQMGVVSSSFILSVFHGIVMTHVFLFTFPKTSPKALKYGRIKFVTRASLERYNSSSYSFFVKSLYKSICKWQVTWRLHPSWAGAAALVGFELQRLHFPRHISWESGGREGKGEGGSESWNSQFAFFLTKEALWQICMWHNLDCGFLHHSSLRRVRESSNTHKEMLVFLVTDGQCMFLEPLFLLHIPARPRNCAGCPRLLLTLFWSFLVVFSNQYHLISN